MKRFVFIDELKKSPERISCLFCHWSNCSFYSLFFSHWPHHRCEHINVWNNRAENWSLHNVVEHRWFLCHDDVVRRYVVDVLLSHELIGNKVDRRLNLIRLVEIILSEEIREQHKQIDDSTLHSVVIRINVRDHDVLFHYQWYDEVHLIKITVDFNSWNSKKFYPKQCRVIWLYTKLV